MGISDMRKKGRPANSMNSWEIALQRIRQTTIKFVCGCLPSPDPKNGQKGGLYLDTLSDCTLGLGELTGSAETWRE